MPEHLRLSRRTITLVLLGIIVGCGPAHDPTNAQAVLIQGPNGSTVRFEQLSDCYGVTDNVSCSIHDGILKVGQRSFGRVKFGDKVKIERDGAVRINGELREPSIQK
jgi:hypothetical protein